MPRMSLRELAAADVQRLVRTLREIGGEGQSIAGGWMSCDVEGSWAVYAAGLGEQGAVTNRDMAKLAAFYRSRGRRPLVQTTPFQHPSVVTCLRKLGFSRVEEEHTLVFDLDQPIPDAPEIVGLSWQDVSEEHAGSQEAFLASQLAGFGGPSASGGASSGARPILQRLLRHSRSHLMLARMGEEVVGSCGLERHGPIAVMIAGTVSGAWRRRGIQRAMIVRRLQLARSLGVSWVLVASTPGGPTERNARRLGFAHGYAMTLWGAPKMPPLFGRSASSSR